MWFLLKNDGGRPDDILGHFGLTTPPVDVERILRGLQVELKLAPIGFDGMAEQSITPMGERVAQITIKDSAPLNRRRFTIAHELGHIMLHQQAKFRDNFRAGGSDYAEVQASRFAAELLMPAWMIRAYYRPPLVTPGALAAVFRVSPQVMDVRLSELGWLPKT